MIGTKEKFPVEEAKKLIEMALHEDVRDGDFTSLWTLPPNQNQVATLIAKQEGVLAGLPIIDLVYKALGEDVKLDFNFQDGDAVVPGDIIVTMEGSTQGLLTGERTLLNFLQQLSGVASITSVYAKALEGSKTVVLDTRKTLPGYRLLQKYAVAAGGGSNHRMGLFDMVLIKDNHIQAAGGVLQSVEAVQSKNDRNLKIEIEVETLDQLKLLLHKGVDVIMLDNMDKATMTEAVKIVEESGDKVKLEGSGNMNLERIKDLKDVGLDFISVGALTHSVTALDISMRIPTK